VIRAAVARSAGRLATGFAVGALAVVGPTAAPAGAGPTPLAVSVATAGSTCPSPGGVPDCASDPVAFSASWPVTDVVAAVSVSFGGPDRMAPRSDPVVVDQASASACTTSGTGQQQRVERCTWSVPPGLYPSGSDDLLNGTYTFTACEDSATDCAERAPSGGLSPTNVTVAVAPSAPTGVRATAAGASVTVRWTLGPEPDLAGYSITRDGRVVATCGLDGASTPACGAAPQVSDRPGPGAWTYAVTAERYGPGGLLASPPTPSAVTVGSSATTGGATTAGGTGSSDSTGYSGTTGSPGLSLPLPPIAVDSPGGSIVAAAPQPDTPSRLAAAPPAKSVPAFSEAIPYVGSGGRPARALAAQDVEAGNTPASVDGPGLVAGALLALAVAAHVWYLRQEARRLGGRRAARSEAAGT
jgi:hypothetical protein